MDPYATLQVIESADLEVIRAAYRALARRFHPDVGGDAMRMAEVNEAWSVLGDPLRRARFDREQRQARARKVAAEAVSRDAGETFRREPTPVMRRTPARERASAPTEPPTEPPARAPGWAPAPSVSSESRARGGGTILDFGRYVGWSISELGRHDPDYLLWLERMPAGRSLRAEIGRALGVHEAPVATATRPAARERPRRTWFR
jgi:curved DNA-binding protein CbpA